MILEKEIPIACSLTGGELQERQKALGKIASSFVGAEELNDGFRFRFPLDDEILQDLISVINLERKCCPFLNFNLQIKAGAHFASLDLTGGQGAKEAVKQLFDWN